MNQNNDLNQVYLVSYPKSGNTWLRFILGTLLYEKKINWRNVNKYVHEVGTKADEPIPNKYGIQLLKSHETFTESYSKVIYIVRDVRDVTISYYHYLIKMNRLEKSVTLDEFIKQFAQGKTYWGRWDDHINGWLNNKNNIPNGFLLIKYEDLQNQTFKEIKKILTLLDIEKSNTEIKQAIKWSSFDNMKKLEEQQQTESYMLKNSDKNLPFVRSGSVGEWQEKLSMNQKEILTNEFGKTLTSLGYDDKF